jgi:hypothetical protein
MTMRPRVVAITIERSEEIGQEPSHLALGHDRPEPRPRGP